MPRRRTGTAFYRWGCWYVQIPLADGTRSKPIKLPHLTEKTEAQKQAAKAKAAELTELAEQGVTAVASNDEGETLEDWGERWLDDRLRRGLRDDIGGTWRKWVVTQLGRMPMASIERADLEGFVEFLDGCVQAYDKASKARKPIDRSRMLSWKTAGNVWGHVTKAFKEAASSKTKALRVRTDDPSAGVQGPDRGTKRAKAWLRPSHLAELLGCYDVELQWRRAIAISIYTYTRAAELRALEWSDVDLDANIIHVTKSLERGGEGDGKPVKNDTPHRKPIEATLRPLLEAMKREAKGKGRVIDLPDDRHLSRVLKREMTKAGIDDKRLTHSTMTTKAMTWHDLRATGITWRAIRGDDPLKIMRAAGHKRFETTNGYIREAEGFEADAGDVFAPLPTSLLNGNCCGNAAPVSGNPTKHSGGAGNRRRPARTIDDDSSAFATSTGPPSVPRRDEHSATYDPRSDSAQRFERAFAAALMVAGDVVPPAAVERVRSMRWPASTTAGELHRALIDAAVAVLEQAREQRDQGAGDVVDLAEQRRKRGAR